MLYCTSSALSKVLWGGAKCAYGDRVGFGSQAAALVPPQFPRVMSKAKEWRAQQAGMGTTGRRSDYNYALPSPSSLAFLVAPGLSSFGNVRVSKRARLPSTPNRLRLPVTFAATVGRRNPETIRRQCEIHDCQDPGSSR